MTRGGSLRTCQNINFYRMVYLHKHVPREVSFPPPAGTSYAGIRLMNTVLPSLPKEHNHRPSFSPKDRNVYGQTLFTRVERTKDDHETAAPPLQ